MPTTKYGLTYIDANHDINDGPADINATLDQVDSKMVGYSSGTLGARPPSTGGSPGIAGRRYRATDTGQEFIDTGTGWVEIVNDLHADKLGLTIGGSTRRGRSIIAAEESRANTAYGLMTTPDRVSGVVLPTDGLLLIAFRALWKESVQGAARLAIFLGATQLRAGTSFNGGTQPLLESAGVSATNNGGSASPNIYRPILLNSANSFAQSPGAFTGDQSLTQPFVLPVFAVEAAAGTYDVSIQFKASSGSVSAKERKLWVLAMGF